MTSAESINFVRMLLDDSRDHYVALPEIIRTLDEAQLLRIREAYTKQDERGMRPLYEYLGPLADGDEVDGLLYPRSCKLVYSIGLGDEFGEQAQYLENDLFQSVKDMEFLPAVVFPRAAYYTIGHEYVTGAYRSFIEISGTGSRAYIWYIKKPVTFSDTVPLAMPREYHPEICALAAEIINNIDVGEIERGERPFQNQFLTLEKAGKIG